MSFELFITRYFWIIPIGFSLWELRSWKSEMAGVRARKPELIGTYKRLKIGERFVYTVPWVVMGLGILIGGSKSIVEYAFPCDGNIVVLAFWLTVLPPVISMAAWIWFFGGAQYYNDLNNLDRSPWILKFKAAGVLLVMFWLAGSGCLMSKLGLINR